LVHDGLKWAIAPGFDGNAQGVSLAFGHFSGGRTAGGKGIQPGLKNARMFKFWWYFLRFVHEEFQGLLGLLTG
jgi:hypothetical protein